MSDDEINISFLASNFLSTSFSPLKQEEIDLLEGQVEEVSGIIQKFRPKTRCKLHAGNISFEELTPFVMGNSSKILHFCGRHDKSFQPGDLPPNLIKLFQGLQQDIRCVILVACYTPEQAEELSHNVDCVIGLPDGIGPKMAKQAIASFFLALDKEKNVLEAIEIANSLLVTSDRPNLKLIPKGRPSVRIDDIRFPRDKEELLLDRMAAKLESRQSSATSDGSPYSRKELQ